MVLTAFGQSGIEAIRRVFNRFVGENGGAALSDHVLKPMLLGRGVDAPIPIILIGALGGMVSAGFIGLFIGAVVLAAGYTVFMSWVAAKAEVDPTSAVSAN